MVDTDWSFGKTRIAPDWNTAQSRPVPSPAWVKCTMRGIGGKLGKAFSIFLAVNGGGVIVSGIEGMVVTVLGVGVVVATGPGVALDWAHAASDNKIKPTKGRHHTGNAFMVYTD